MNEAFISGDLAVAAGGRDTIFALASGAGRAGVAVVRLSGPGADAALADLTHRPLPAPKQATIRTLFDFKTGDRIDQALVLRFTAPLSYTGENVVEFQVHGGRAVIGALLAALGQLPGVRPAEGGEFTRRAVENGRLDLTQAEAIGDLVAAETEAQRHQALRQMEGALGSLYEEWRARAIRACAWLEASIDFADEEVPEDALARARENLAGLATEIGAHLNDGRRGEILREGFQVAIMGPPNAGKSSLLNALAQRDVAIVSETAGTTRDVIEVRLDLGGYPVILADTAGLREGSDAVEAEGVRRAYERGARADLRLIVQDGTAPEQNITLADGRSLRVWSKADLCHARGRDGLWISVKSGEGLSALIAALTAVARDALQVNEAPVLTRARHRHALEEAKTALARASVARGADIAAEEARIGLRALGRITGRVDLDDLLDVVFRDFCIGK